MKDHSDYNSSNVFDSSLYGYTYVYTYSNLGNGDTTSGQWKRGSRIPLYKFTKHTS